MANSDIDVAGFGGHGGLAFWCYRVAPIGWMELDTELDHSDPGATG